MKRSFACILKFGPVLLLMTALFPSASRAQYRAYPDRTHSTPEAESRAEQEAEQMVSLSAEKIVQLLQQEPGLLLQVKKMLVRKAYEQGRLLDPADLTDEALFRLLREDQNICILATHELEDRSYIRPKPTRDELERDSDRTAQK